MAATAGEWLTVTGDSGNSVKHQWKISYDGGHEEVDSPPFNWPVMGDFTIATSTHISATGVAEAAENGNTVTTIQGSVDGTNYVDLDGSGTMQANGAMAGIYVYDFDSKGLMPHMRLQVNPSVNDTIDVYVTVTPHHMV